MTDEPVYRPAAGRLMTLVATGRAAERALEGRLAGSGFTLRQVGILGHLRRNPELSFSELVRRSDVSVQAVHEVVGELVSRGFIRAVVDLGTPTIFAVTDAGEQALRAFKGHVAALDRDLADVDVDIEELIVAARVLGGPGLT